MAHKRKFVYESSDDEESTQEGQYCYKQREKRIKNLQKFDKVIDYDLEEVKFAVEGEEIEEDPEETEEEQHDLNQDQDQEQEQKDNEEELIKERSSKRRLWRLWNDEDEIKVLEGMLEFHKKDGNYGSGVYTSEFYEFIKDLIQININRKQLTNKIRRLKIKYLNNKEKAEAADGEDLLDSFNDHEKKLFLLSEKIWGDQEIEQEDENGSCRREEDEFWYKFPRLDESLKLEQFSKFTLPGTGTNFVKEKLICIGDLKAKELEEKWRELQVAELKVKLMKAKLIQEQTEVILSVTN